METEIKITKEQIEHCKIPDALTDPNLDSIMEDWAEYVSKNLDAEIAKNLISFSYWLCNNSFTELKSQWNKFRFISELPKEELAEIANIVFFK